LKKDAKRTWTMKHVWITALIGLGIVLIAILSRGIFSAKDSAAAMMILADAFTLSGGLLLGAWVFAWVSGEGGFLFIEYTASIIRKIFTSRKKSLTMEDREESYGDYVERKQSHGRGRRYLYVCYVGAFYFIMSLVFSVLFYQMGG